MIRQFYLSRFAASILRAYARVTGCTIRDLMVAIPRFRFVIDLLNELNEGRRGPIEAKLPEDAYLELKRMKLDLGCSNAELVASIYSPVFLIFVKGKDPLEVLLRGIGREVLLDWVRRRSVA